MSLTRRSRCMRGDDLKLPNLVPDDQLELSTMAEEPGLAGKFSPCAMPLTLLFISPSASVIAINRLAGSLINNCYDHQLRSDRNTSVDLKPTIDCLRNLSNVLHHHLYTAAYGEHSNDHPLSSSSNLNKADGPLMQCTTELHTLERVLETGNWPPSDTDLTNTLENLNRIKAELDAHGRSVRRSPVKGALNINYFQDCTGRHQCPENKCYRFVLRSILLPTLLLMTAD